VNRLSFPRSALWPCWQATLLLLLVGLSGAARAQKPTDAPPADTPTATSHSSESSLAPDQKEALSQKQMLAQDKRLDRLISLDVISVPLGEVLQKESLDKSTEKMEDGNRFLLTASSDCADLKMQIRLNNRPLRTLMTALAQMLPGVWTRTPHGYQLGMTKEAANARAEWWRLFLGEREKALAVQRQAVLTTMQTKARRGQIGDSDIEQSDRAGEEETADQQDFFHSLPQALKKQIAANMDDSAFYEVGQVGFGNSGEQTGTLGWLGQMSPQTQEMFKTALQDNVSRMAQEPPALQGYARQAQSGLAALDPNRVYFLFQNGGTVVMATPINAPPGANDILILRVPRPLSLPVLMLDQTQLAGEVYGGAKVPPAWKRRADDARKMGEAAPPELRRLAYDVYGMGEATPDEWKRLAAYQRRRVWPNLLPKLPPEDYSAPQVVISRAAQTDWLGEQGHMEYVCDYYSHGGYAMPEAQKKQPVRRPLARELDEMASRRDVSWTKNADGIYLVRNNRWYRDDGLEVPESLLRRWFGALVQARRQETARRQAALGTPPPAETQAAAQKMIPQPAEERTAALRQTWDWAAEVFSALTPWQIRNGLSLFQPEEKDLGAQNDATAAKLYEKLKHRVPQPGEVAPPGYDEFTEMTRRPPFWSAINTLKGFPRTAQFYGSLDDAGRSALLAGHLPASALSPSQLAQAVALQPFLPAALQHSTPDSVLLSLPCDWRASDRVVFGEAPLMRLEVETPPSAPPTPASPQ